MYATIGRNTYQMSKKAIYHFVDRLVSIKLGASYFWKVDEIIDNLSWEEVNYLCTHQNKLYDTILLVYHRWGRRRDRLYRLPMKFFLFVRRRLRVRHRELRQQHLKEEYERLYAMVVAYQSDNNGQPTKESVRILRIINNMRRQSGLRSLRPRIKQNAIGQLCIFIGGR